MTKLKEMISNNLVVILIGLAVIAFGAVSLTTAYSGGGASTVIENCNNCFGGGEGFGAAPSGDFTALTDLYIEDALTVDGTVALAGGVFDLTTSTATTTPGIFSRDNTSATTTISAGDDAKLLAGCFELVTSAGAYVRTYVAGGTTALVTEAGGCN